jgi:hypothetical protein
MVSESRSPLAKPALWNAAPWGSLSESPISKEMEDEKPPARSTVAV